MNRRSFFGFLVAAPVVPLMARSSMASGGIIKAYDIGDIRPELFVPDMKRWSAELASPGKERQLAWNALRAKMWGHVKTIEIETDTSDAGNVVFLRKRLISDWVPA